LLALAVSAIALPLGGLHLRWGNATLLRSSPDSAYRALIIGSLLVWLAGSPRLAVRALVALGLAMLLPVSAYRAHAERLTAIDHPLRTLRDCTAATRHDSVSRSGVYNAAALAAHHSYNYYFGRLGPWRPIERPDQRELLERLFTPDAQTPVILSTDEYHHALALTAPPGSPIGEGASVAMAVPAINPELGLVILMPGPFATCTPAAVAAGGRLVNRATWGTDSD
jgi:hypothetical protein